MTMRVRVVRMSAVVLWLLVPRVSSSAEHRSDLSGSKGETVFFVLGMLDEYGGRDLRNETDIVERFYCNEHVNAFVFRAYLDRLAREQGLSSEVETRWYQDCLVSFHSKEMRDFVNQFYIYEPGAEPADAYTRGESASLSWVQLGGRDRALQLAYLAGAYFRYGRNGGFRFANASAKRNLVAKLVEQIGCTDTRTSSREGLPYQNEVLFTPTSEVRTAFEQMPASWSLLQADSVVGIATLDELAIYRELIREARAGHFEGCALPDSVPVGRFTTIPMAKLPAIPGVSREQREALDDYRRAAVTLRSVSGLASDSMHLSRDNGGGPMIVFGRVGFSKGGGTAAVLLSFATGTDADPSRCFVVAVAFLSSHNGRWETTGYSTP